MKQLLSLNGVFHGSSGIILQNGHYSWASYQIRKIVGCAFAGNAGNVFFCRRIQRKLLVSDPGMPGSLTRAGGGNVPGIPGACAPAIVRIWQEAHGTVQQKPNCTDLTDCRWFAMCSVVVISKLILKHCGYFTIHSLARIPVHNNSFFK